MLWFQRVAAAAIVWCLIVVVLGAWVRLSDAGLGCPDWPGCYGQLLVPEGDAAIQQANEAYPERPVEIAKAWKEVIHRIAAGTLGLLILWLAILGFKNRKQPGQPWKLPLLLVALVIFQAILGMWTVTLLLKPLIVTAHLAGGMTTLALLWWVWLRSQRRPGNANDVVAPWQQKSLRRWSVLALHVLVLQMLLGAWTSTNYAALACPDFPTCQQQWIPETDFSEAFTLWRGLGTNYEFGVLDNRARVTIHFVHRLWAVVTVVIILMAAWVAWRRFGQTRAAVALATACIVQVSIGISAVLLDLPLAVAAAHNAGAAMLLLATLYLLHRSTLVALDPPS